jgi:hypothetical protein
MRSGESFVLAAILMSIACPIRGAEAPQEDKFQENVLAAIERGAGSVIPIIGRIRESPGDYPMGRIALPVAALIRSGIPTTDSGVEACLKTLEGIPPKEVYSVVCYLMALDALVQARAKEVRKRKNAQDGSPTLMLQAAVVGPEKVRMEEMVKWLISVRNRGEGTWHYGGEEGHDYSNTQFAVLGLQIGREHGIAIPKDVFVEIAWQFGRSVRREKDEMEVKIVFNADRKSFLAGGKGGEATFNAAPGGWGYTSEDWRPYASMTAAGCSSLLVARDVLGGSFPPLPEKALDASLAWIAANLDRFLVNEGRCYYALYSLEKVGDLGNIASLNGRDWYREGAESLLKRQASNGSWGDYLDTSFALLFLTRATRPPLRSLPAPIVKTLADGGGQEQGDLVHVGSVGGYVSAREFFQYLEATGDRQLLGVAEEIVRNYPLSRRGDLVPLILPLGTGGTPTMTAFAKKALADATGETYGTADEYLRWHESYAKVRALETGGEKDPERISLLLARAPGTRLKARIVELIGRERLVACAPALIEALPTLDGAFAKRASEVLARIAGGKAPPGAGGDDPQASAAAWGSFWQMHGERLMTDARVRALVRRIESPPAEDQGTAVAPTPGKAPPPAPLDALIAEGLPAVPGILEAMERGEYPVALIAALERISGKKLGLRPGPWKAWWKSEKK